MKPTQISAAVTNRALEDFAGFVMKNHKEITPRIFAEELGKIQKTYMCSQQKDLFCSEAELLATKLAEHKHNDFAGIVISALCKITQFFPEKLEPLALKGYEIAKSNGDYIHMMARLNDLRKIYQGNPEKVYKYVQVLYKQESCLKELTTKYEAAVKSYHSVIRKPVSQKEYEQMLAFVQTEIAKLTRRKHPQQAMERLISAKAIFEQSNNRQHLSYIDMMLAKISKDIY